MDVAIRKIRNYMSEHHMTRPGDRIVVGVSGGADSLCLLFALWELLREDCSLEVVHVDHMIRGEEAEADALFVEDVCRTLGIPCSIFHVDCPKEAGLTGESLEEAGRRLRFARFLSVGADRIAVAHHMGDQAETVLGNMIRGSGLAGMGGIRPVSEYRGIPVIHPLLCLTRAEIEEYLAGRKQEFRRDSTNGDLHYTRNRIRREILPEAQLINPEAVQHICRTAEHLRQAQEYLEEQLDGEYRSALSGEDGIAEEGAVRLSAGRLMDMNPFAAGAVLRRAYGQLTGSLKDFESVHVDLLLQLCKKQSGRCASLPGGVSACRENDLLILRRGEDRMGTGSPDPLPKLVTRIFTLEGPVPAERIPKETYTKWFDYDKITSCVVLRRRQEGDYISFDFGKQKLQDYLVNEKVPRSRRDTIPLLAQGSEILWVVGKRIGSRAKVTEQTRTILECRIIPGESGDGKERTDGQ